MWKHIRRLSLLLILLIVTALAWTTFSQSGTRWALQLFSKQLESLNLQGISGRLYDGVQIDTLSYHNADTRIDAEAIGTEWDVGCLLQKKLCLQNIHFEQLSIELPAPSEDASPVENTEFSIPAVPLDILLKNASIGTLSWTQGGTVQTLEDISLSGQANHDTIQINHAALRWQDNNATLNGSIKIREHYPLNAHLSIKMPTLLGTESNTLNLSIQGFIGGALNLKAQLSGSQNASLTATVHPLEKPLKLDGTLAAIRLQSLEENNPALVLENLEMLFSGDSEKLSIDSKARISGLQIPPTELHINTNMLKLGSLEDIHLKLEALDGQAEITGRAGWQPALHWQLESDFSNIDISQYRADIAAILSGSLKSAGEQRNGRFFSPQTTAEIKGSLQGKPLIAELQLSFSKPGAIELQKLELHSGENHLSAKGRIDQHLSIDTQLSAPDLGSLYPGLAGALQGTIKARGNRSKPDIHADLSGTAVAFQNYAADRLKIQAKINKGGTEDSQLSLKTDHAQAPGLQNLSMDAKLSGTLNSHVLTLSAHTSEQTSDLQLQGQLSGNQWQGTLNRALLSHQQLALKLQSPTPIAWNQDTAKASISAHCWTHLEASLCLEKDALLSKESGSATLALKGLDLSGFNPLLPDKAKLSGILQAGLQGQWAQGTEPQLNIHTQATELSLNTTAPSGQSFQLNFNQAELSAVLDKHQGDLKLQLRSPEQGSTHINAHIDPTSKALSGTVDIQGFLLEPLQALLPMLDTLRGEINTQGVLTGTLTAPQFKGKMQLSHPALAGADIPLVIDGGELLLDIDGHEATLHGELLTQPSGTLRIQGGLSYTDALRAKLSLTGEALAVALPPAINATVNHQLSLTIDPETLELGGTVHIPSATIVLDDITGSIPRPSKDLVFTDAEEQPEQAGQMDMDLLIQVGEKVQLSGYGLNTRLQGDIKLRQRPGQPMQLAGELALKEGSYKAYGQDLDIRRGELLFVGPLRATRVDVTAVRVVDKVEAGLTLEGNLLTPEATLFSDPTMGDAEILSYIVLGGPPGQGGDKNAIIARAALSQGLKNGNRIASQLANAAGIEDFNIGADGKGDDTAVVLSGKLSPKLLLSYRLKLFDTVNTLTARYDLSQNLYLELMRGVEQAIDIFYTVDY